MSGRSGSAGERAAHRRLRHPLPTLRGWCLGGVGVLFLIAAGVFARIDLLFAGLVLTLAPLLALVLLARSRPWLDVARSASPESVPVGEASTVRLEVRNQSPRPVSALRWRDRMPDGVEGEGVRSFPPLARRSLSRADRSDTVVLRHPARPMRRGAFPLGPLVVGRTDPFGLAYGEYAVGERKTLLATPRVVPLGLPASDDTRGEGRAQELVRHAIPSVDEVIAREYRAGDPLRRVHWRATARQGELMVRQEEQRSNPQAWLLFDTVRRSSSHSEAVGAGFEAAVELLASIGVHLLEQGYVVGVVETGARQLAGRPGAAGAAAGVAAYELPGGDGMLPEQLAAVTQQPEPRSDHVALFAGALRRSGSTAPAFAILCDGGADDPTHLATAASLGSPAVAFLLSSSAETVRGELEAGGWLCVTVSPGTATEDAWHSAASALEAVPAQAGVRDV